MYQQPAYCGRSRSEIPSLSLAERNQQPIVKEAYFNDAGHVNWFFAKCVLLLNYLVFQTKIQSW